MAHFRGTEGDDSFTGTKRADKFDVSQGGNDTIVSGGGNDQINFGAAFTADDKVDGGGSSTVLLSGDYSAGVVFGAETMVNVARLSLAAGHSYNFTFNQTTITSTHIMTVDATLLGATDSVTIDASATAGAVSLQVTNAGSVTFKGGAQDDTLTVTNAGPVTFLGGAGDDTLTLGREISAADHIDMGTSGAGHGGNTLNLQKGITGHFVFDNVSNVDNLNLKVGGTYDLAVTDNFEAAGRTTSFHGNFLTFDFTFDGSAETDAGFGFDRFNGTVNIIGGGGNDRFEQLTGTIDGGAGGFDTFIHCSGTLTGGPTGATFVDSSGTIFTSTGSYGFDDVDGTVHLENSAHVSITRGTAAFLMGGSLDSADSIDTAAALFLDGDYSAGVSLNTITAAKLMLAGGHSYAFTATDSTVDKGVTMTVDGSALGATDSLHFDGSAEKNGLLTLTGGAGDDVLIGGDRAGRLTGGQGQDVLKGGLSNDTLSGGGASDTIDGGMGGNDHFIYRAVTDSTGIHYDTLIGFSVTRDFFGMNVSVKDVDAHILDGQLDNTGGALFNQELAAAVDAAHLLPQHAVLFTPDSGNLAGHTFLIVDANGVAGYQAGQDYVIDMVGATGLDSLNKAEFR